LRFLPWRNTALWEFSLLRFAEALSYPRSQKGKYTQMIRRKPQDRNGIRILILEDVPTDAELAVDVLSRAGIDFVPALVEDRDSFVHSLVHFSPDIILSDYSLPRFDGGTALLIAREIAPEVPFIFVTGAVGEELAVDLLKRGATDFVLKDRLSRLPLCVNRALKEWEERRIRREAEESLRKAHAELELKVAELRSKNQALQDFAFAASHDLMEPLRKVQLIGSLLREKKKDRLGEDGRDYLLRMENSAKRMQLLLDALLSYSLASKRDCPFEPLELNRIVREAASNLEVPMQEAQACIEIGSLPCALGDARQMVQVFQNLLSNAIKYRRSPPVIRVHGEKDNDLVRIFVEDNGIGFEPKYRERIFKPFQRLHGRDEYEGIGMGLTISRRILELHGGKLDAVSTPGKGSTFIIELPGELETGDPQPLSLMDHSSGKL
jgi:signal transduction histidine kinase